VTLMQEYGLDKLPRDRRLDLAHELWASLEDSSDSHGLTPEMDAEIDRRHDAYEADPTMAVDLEEIERRHSEGYNDYVCKTTKEGLDYLQAGRLLSDNEARRMLGFRTK
jgi:putative addiction module component (TIGR02574 family)